MTTTREKPATRREIKHLAAELKREWEELVARRERGEAEADNHRAALLQVYHSKGMTRREISDIIGLTNSHVSHLLRYQRFLISTGIKNLPEDRFRAYWAQIADPAATRGNRALDHAEKVAAYEAEVFPAIARLIEEGKSPLRPERKEKAPEPGSLKSVKDVRREARKVYKRLKPTLAALKGLLRCDRATFAPNLISGHAQVLDREIKELFRLLAGDDAAATNGECS
jgi:DNA-binding transcriptional ArsR family regulator